MKPKIASAQSPSDRIRTKKTPMIALKSVKTLPATIEATERLFGGAGSPSVVEAPGGLGSGKALRMESYFHRLIYTQSAPTCFGPAPS